MSIVVFLIILAVLILVHEFGHFIVAKKSGIRVDEFGLGFPPKIFAKKWGSTLYTLNAIPFGGFVKIFGEDSHESISEEDKSGSFVFKSKWIQSAVLVAGVTFNLIFAWVLISLSFVIGVPTPVNYQGLGKVSNAHLTITEVLQNSPAQMAGLKSGDYIVSVNAGKASLSGTDLTPENFQNIISETTTKNIELSFVRGKNSTATVSIEPNSEVISGRRAIGIAMDEIGTLKLPIHLAVLEGARISYFLIKGTALGLASFLWNAILFKSDFSQISGPIGIAGVVGEATKLGFTYIISLTALISINLAIINLLPFPALDGGRLLFVAIEAVRRKPISPTFVRNANFIGFALLLILMVVVSAHDIFKLF